MLATRRGDETPPAGGENTVYEVYALTLAEGSTPACQFLYREPSHDPITLHFYCWLPVDSNVFLAATFALRRFHRPDPPCQDPRKPVMMREPSFPGTAAAPVFPSFAMRTS